MAKVVGFYDQYKRNLSKPLEWATPEDGEVSSKIRQALLEEMVMFDEVFDDTFIRRFEPFIYLRDLNYNPLAYWVMEGVVIYLLPETYVVPSLHSKAKVLPDLEIGSIMNQLIKSMENKNLGDMFDSYHQAMIYGEINFDDKLKSEYTRFEWIKLTEILKQDSGLTEKLNGCLAKMSTEGYTIESVARNISWFLEKDLKECLKKVNQLREL